MSFVENAPNPPVACQATMMLPVFFLGLLVTGRVLRTLRGRFMNSNIAPDRREVMWDIEARRNPHTARAYPHLSTGSE